MISTAHRMESLSRAYLQAVAAQAGLTFSFRVYDYGTDLTLSEVREVDGIFTETGFLIDVQLRSSTRSEVREDAVMYDVDVRTYDYLRRDDVLTPRILVLLVLPADEVDWIHQSEAALELRRCAYWISLQGHPETANKSSVRITIPRTNVFGVSAAAAMLDRLHNGERI